MTLLNRFLDYVNIPTSSDHASDTVPTAKKEFVLARRLVSDLHEIGVTDAYMDEKCYVYGHIPAAPGYEDRTKIGFIAHIDTSPDFADGPMHVQIIENYDGHDVKLGESGRIITNAAFPHLKTLVGRTLITTDGTTLLGADDKAGVAEIMHALAKIIADNTPHGPISVCFTPDEECGTSADNFNLAAFDAEFAYTVDGSSEGEVVYENFNACAASFEVNGFNIHPGSAKNRMINASLVAMEINAMLPSGETPRDTEGYEGFYHLTGMHGDETEAHLAYIIRDHSMEKFNQRKAFFMSVAEFLNAKYGEGTIEAKVTDSYYNMREIIEQHMEIGERAENAYRAMGIEPFTVPVRGGTDGCRLSFMGLPCPNLSTGGMNGHGLMECVAVQDMDLMVDVLQKIIEVA